ncbi:hypothetical protein ACHWQZ_G011420 [Mnemiopsis leidyi]
MTNYTVNSNPNELTSFDRGASPDSSGTFLKYFLDFVRPSSNSSSNNGSGSSGATGDPVAVATRAPLREPASDTPSQVRKVTPFESMFTKSGGRAVNIPVSKHDSDSSNDFKKYWMPDDQCKECYECGILFTTFKRRHHCRLCGQIFCYDCCSDVISGKIAGYGDAEVQLRVCKYCLQSKSKHQKVERKRSNTNKGLIFSSPTLDRSSDPETPLADPFSDLLQEELKDEDVKKINQHFMWSLFRSPNSTIPVQPSWYRLRYFSETYHEGDILTWLTQHLQKPEEAAAMLQDWVETCRLEPINPARNIFKVGPKDDYNENTVMLYEQIKREPEKNSTNWIHRMVQEAKASSQSFDIHNSGSVTSFVHVDVDKDLDEEYWQSSEATLNTSQSLNDTMGLELNRIIDSMNCTAKIFLKSEQQVGSDVLKNAENYGIEILKHCIKQEKSPNPNLNIPPFGEVPELEVSIRDSTERKASNLSGIYDDHMDAILDTLIDKEHISTSWRAILKKLVGEAANDVTPNPMSGDSMDIRKYVKFKKLHGQPKESCILDGYVCTKTIAHKKMQSRIGNPKIMLLYGSISYQRVLNKLTSLNPVFLQEKEFLTKVVSRVASFEPDVLIVEKSVSQIAKDELLNKGITLILNLKQGQIEKIARCLQGDIVQNLENVNFIPASDESNNSSKNKLGHCKDFRAEFMKGFCGASKPLLFFNGCDKNLTKTILLRGENKLVLKKVKKVAMYYLYALYNRRLEFNYLKKSRLTWRDPGGRTRSNSQVSEAPTFVSHSNTNINGHNSPSLSLVPDYPHSLPGSTSGSDVLFLGTSPSNSKVSVVSGVVDHDDISEDGSMSGYLAVTDADKALEDMVNNTLFSVTPFCRPSVPYLCTEEGSKCPTRNYFDDMIYFSAQLLTPDPSKTSDPLAGQNTQQNGNRTDLGHSLSPTRPVITSCSADDLAFYRAFGYWEFEKDHRRSNNGSLVGEECHPEAPCHIQSRFEQNLKGKDIDFLEFYHHQKLLVLFSSLSVKSFNHPQPCISPWSLSMQFYGKNDLTLGLFLRDYCYQSTYQCPEQCCKTDIVDHERRFVHNGQSVNLKMSKLSSVIESVSNTPITWSVCTKCLHMSDITIVSKETWNYSFAKFLELKFYENCLFVRGPCPHSYHRYHTNFFALGNMVACFTRNDIKITEVVPLFSRYNFEDKFTDINVSNGVLLNETVTKINSALKAVNEKLEACSGLEENILKDSKTKLATEDTTFRQKLTDITSDLSRSPIEVRRLIYRLQSDLVFSIDTWNKYLADIKRKPKSKPANYASSEMLSSTPDDSPSTLSPKVSKRICKSHRRVRSDGYLDLRDEMLSKPFNNPSAFHRSVDDLFSTKKTETCLCVDGSGGVLEKSCVTKVDGDIRQESRLSKMASGTKKLFKALTDSYKKIEPLFPIEEHHHLTGGSRPTVLVNEKHFTSIIAYALSCEQYRAKLQLLKPGSSTLNLSDQSPSSFPSSRRTSNLKSYSSGTLPEVEDKVGHWLTVTSNGSGDHPGTEPGSLASKQQPSYMSHRREKSTDQILGEENVINKSNHIDVDFQDGPTKFYCKVYFAAEFDKLRNLLMPGEALDDFIHSLSYCNKWRAKGGKSGLAFSKTQDDRWVVKEMSRLELQALLMFMPNYVEYVTDSIDKRPTLLAKIIGACTVGFNNTYTGVSMKQDVIIMENIFYGVNPSTVYDLKGSARNRLAEEADEVLLDENYLHHIVDHPVYLRPHSKTFLREAVNCDTAFLAAQSIIDYSLLVGMCGDKIVIGIIDYIRKFTFDKKVEMIFKTNMIGSAGRMPTIVSPEMYRERFCNQIERYFPLVPDKWTGMGSDLHYS